MYQYANANPINAIDPFGLESYLSGFGDVTGLRAFFDENGNLVSGFSAQDQKCSTPFTHLNTSQAAKDVCCDHDNCFDANDCNFTSWAGNIVGVDKACQQCNWDAFNRMPNALRNDPAYNFNGEVFNDY